MEGPQISLVVTSNALAPLAHSETTLHQYYPVNYVVLHGVSCLKPGVVDQPNGQWGAYLCANNEHIWLGSFETEEEAAFMAQQSASIQFCNVAWPALQLWSNFPTNMTMENPYATQFPNFLMAQVQEKPDSAALPDPLGYHLRQLFMKELTPSDAGKLNRLVIPKRYAVRHLPRICEDGGAKEEAEVKFFDMSMKLWTFRYCYWNSSQSYVFTRGWKAFLKEKCLKPKDKVIFSAYQRCSCEDHARKLYIIDVSYENNGGDGQIQYVTHNGVGFQPEFAMAPAGIGGHGNEEVGRMDIAQPDGYEERGVKLFGVNMI